MYQTVSFTFRSLMQRLNSDLALVSVLLINIFKDARGQAFYLPHSRTKSCQQVLPRTLFHLVYFFCCVSWLMVSYSSPSASTWKSKDFRFNWWWNSRPCDTKCMARLNQTLKRSKTGSVALLFKYVLISCRSWRSMISLCLVGAIIQFWPSFLGLSLRCCCLYGNQSRERYQNCRSNPLRGYSERPEHFSMYFYDTPGRVHLAYILLSFQYF